MSVQKFKKKTLRKKSYPKNAVMWKSIIDNSVIRCDNIIQTTKSIIAKIVLVKTVLTNFDEKR